MISEIVQDNHVGCSKFTARSDTVSTMSQLRALVAKTRDLVSIQEGQSQGTNAVHTIVYALSVARGAIPAYQHPLTMLYYVKQAIEMMQGPKAKKLKTVMGEHYDRAFTLLKKYEKGITNVEAKRQAMTDAQGDVAELDQENQALSQKLWEV